jgi:hypothetical protein
VTRPLLFVAAGLATLTHAPAAFAHALGAECRLTGGRVEVTAFYDDDTPAADAAVTVRDAGSVVVASGRTDAKGLWSFAAPPGGKYRVAVDAGDGHKASVGLTVPGGPPAGSADATADPAVVSDGPARADFTRAQWLKLGVGLAAIALMAAGYGMARRVGGRG